MFGHFIGEAALYYLLLTSLFTAIGAIGTIVFCLIHPKVADGFSLFLYSTLALLFSDFTHLLIDKYDISPVLGTLIIFIPVLTALTNVLRAKNVWSIFVLIESIVLYFVPSTGLLYKLPWLISIVEWVKSIPALFVIVVIISIPVFIACLISTIQLVLGTFALICEMIYEKKHFS